MTHTFDDEPLGNDEFPDEEDCDDSDATVPCSQCGRMIYDGAEQCPYCKTWGGADHLGPSHGLRRIAWSLIVFLLIGVILVMWHGLGR